MRAGDLDEIITFQMKDLKRSDFGGTSVNWIDAFTTNATVIYKGGGRSINVNEIFISSSYTFYIRIYHKVDESMRIIYNGKKYKILSIFKNKSLQAIEIQGELINE